MLVFQTSSMGVDFFSYVKTFLCRNKFAQNALFLAQFTSKTRNNSRDFFVNLIIAASIISVS